MKKSKIRSYLIISMSFGIMMGLIFRIVTPVFVTFKSDTCNIIFTSMCFAAGIAVGYASFFIGKLTLLKTITQIKDYTTNLSQGEFRKELAIDSDDEIGEIAASLTSVVRQLREVLNNISLSTEEISEASNEMSMGAQELAEGVVRQTKAASEVCDTMGNISQLLENGTKEVTTTEEASIKMKQGINIMGQSTHESISTIKEIASKSMIINEIANQTNILALNAAVESARVGEYGKGFLVVASEVRKLAERSKVAADQIDQISQNSIKLTRHLGDLTGNLIQETEKTSVAIQKIANSTMKQNNELARVKQAIGILNQVTDQNNTSSALLAQNAEHLQVKSTFLKEQIGFFKI